MHTSEEQMSVRFARAMGGQKIVGELGRIMLCILASSPIGVTIVRFGEKPGPARGLDFLAYGSRIFPLSLSTLDDRSWPSYHLPMTG